MKPASWSTVFHRSSRSFHVIPVCAVLMSCMDFSLSYTTTCVLFFSPYGGGTSGGVFGRNLVRPPTGRRFWKKPDMDSVCFCEFFEGSEYVSCGREVSCCF